MRSCKIMWIGIDGIDAFGDTLEEAVMATQRHVAQFMLDHEDGIDQLRRDIADGKIKTTFTTLTINDDREWDDGKGNATPPVMVINLFPSA